MVGVPVSNQDRYVQNTVVQSRDAAISYLRPAYGGSLVLTMPPFTRIDTLLRGLAPRRVIRRISLLPFVDVGGSRHAHTR